MLVRKKEHKDPITIGKKQLFIEDIRSFESRLREPFTLITGTPIFMRISREKYLKYDINQSILSLHILEKGISSGTVYSQLEENLRTKYTEFTGKGLNDETIIQKLTFRKQISTRLQLHDQEPIVILTLWEFSFDNELNTELLRFGLDCGLGKRNSMGFGFVNVKKSL